MKSNRMKSIMASLLLTAIFVSCTDSFLSIPPKGSFASVNYYTTRDQAYTGLVAIYDGMRKNTGGFENMVALLNAGSDDQVAGGASSTDGLQFHVFDDFVLTPTNVASSYWGDHYQGIFRANILLSELDGITMDANEKARFGAETKALRGLFYFNLVRLFKNIPLLLKPLNATDMYSVLQADPKDVYAQIETDLTDAVGVLPTSVSATESGRLTKGAVQALLGKVYLYEGKNAQAATQFADVNGTPGGTSMYGYKLMTKFSDLWVVANKFNSESVMECTHTYLAKGSWGGWGSGTDLGNSLCVMSGIRNYKQLKSTSTAPPAMPGGWSFNTFTQDFYNTIKSDPRFAATVLDLHSYVLAGEVSYTLGDKDLGYYLNKFNPRPSDVTPLGGTIELNYQQDSYIIRLADTYLMEAEALGATGARAQALLDAVRARVGLPSVPVSLAAIKAERRLELAGEGHRFFDLVRWGDAGPAILGANFVVGKHEILPIPYLELKNTKLVQNPGYDTN